MDSTQLQKVSSRLGDAALDPTIWPHIMKEICRAINAQGAILLQSDVRTPDVPYTESITDLVETYFRDGWHKREYRERGLPLLLGGAQVFTDQDITTPEQMRKEPYYNECFFPNGFPWFAGVGFRAGAALWVLCLQRTTRQGPFDSQEAHLLAGLSQPLTEAATLSSAIGRIVLSSSTNALNSVRHAAIALDHSGFVLDVNAATGAIFGEDIRVKNRRLWVTDPKGRSCLEDLIRQLATGPDAAALSGLRPIVVRREGRHPIVINVMPVPPAARNPFLGARAILTLVPMEPKPGPDSALLAKAFGLTPAEAKLASIIADGTSLERAAEQLNISRETARTELKVVFAKTDTHRQSQLVALVSQCQ